MNPPTVTHQAQRLTLSMMMQALSACGPPCLCQVDVPGGERWHVRAGALDGYGDDPHGAVVAAYVAWRRSMDDAA